MMRGYTLIELMIVIGLLAIIMTYSVLNIDILIPSTRLEAAGRTIGSTISLARERSTITQRRHGIGFDLKARKYWLVLPPQEKILVINGQEVRYTEKDEMPPETLPTGIAFSDVALTSETKYRDGKVEITFSPLGVSDGFAVHLANNAGDRYTVEIPPLTGVPNYHEGYQECSFAIEEAASP